MSLNSASSVVDSTLAERMGQLLREAKTAEDEGLNRNEPHRPMEGRTTIRVTTTPSNEFDEDDLIYMGAFPHLFPFGRGVDDRGVEDREAFPSHYGAC